MELSLHAGAAEVPARLLLLERQELEPGATAWAQLRLAEPVALARGDRIVLRTPNDTVAGGEIVDARAKRHRRFHQPVLDQLAALRAGRVIDVGGLAITPEALDALGARAREIVSAYHDAHPLRTGIAVDELCRRLRLEQSAFDAALERWRAQGHLERTNNVVALPGRAPALSAKQQHAADQYLAALDASPYAPTTDVSIDAEVLAHLEDAGLVVRTSGGVVFAAASYHDMVDRVTQHLREYPSITLAQVRDMFGTSRKYAQALLEHLDARHITRRVGDERVLRNP
jgi:selenocysteine-specific elongation factor